MVFIRTIKDDFLGRPRGQQELKSAVEIAKQETDSERRGRRDAIRKRIAEGELAERRWRGVLYDIDAVNQKKELLAAEHVESCASLQSELADIEQQQMRAIVARAPADAALEQRRGELLAELRAANEMLEDGITAQDRLLAKLEIERVENAKQVPTNQGPSESDLFATGNPVLIAKFELAKHDRDCAVKRLELLSDPLAGATEAELLQAARCVERCRREASAVYDAVVDE